MLPACAVLLLLCISKIAESSRENIPLPFYSSSLARWTRNTTMTTPSIPDGIFKTEGYYSTLRSDFHRNATTPSPYNPDTDAVTYRLSRLEVELGEKVGQVRRELRERNRRVEWENAATKSEVERLKKELERMSDQQRQDSANVVDSGNLERRIENLSTMIKVMLTNMRILTADIASIKKNLTGLATQTEHVVQSNSDLLTKQFFNHGLMELRHKHHLSATCEPQPTKITFPKHCGELKVDGKSSGIYRIKPESSPAPFMVFCDMDARDGGWTVIQNRYDGSQDFYQNWHDYKHGFGNLGGEFWLGLENLYYLTGHEVNELLIELEDFNAVSAYARYAAFSLGSELEGYPLKVLGGYSGNAGDSLIYQAGNRFSTKDMDHDGWPEGSCALAHGGGWWYRGCDTSNLNGRYFRGKLPEQLIYQGMYWGDFGGPLYSLSKARMMVRPRDENSPAMFTDIRNSTFEDY